MPTLKSFLSIPPMSSRYTPQHRIDFHNWDSRGRHTSEAYESSGYGSNETEVSSRTFSDSAYGSDETDYPSNDSEHDLYSSRQGFNQQARPVVDPLLSKVTTTRASSCPTSRHHHSHLRPSSRSSRYYNPTSQRQTSFFSSLPDIISSAPLSRDDQRILTDLSSKLNGPPRGRSSRRSTRFDIHGSPIPTRKSTTAPASSLRVIPIDEWISERRRSHTGIPKSRRTTFRSTPIPEFETYSQSSYDDSSDDSWGNYSGLEYNLHRKRSKNHQPTTSNSMSDSYRASLIKQDRQDIKDCLTELTKYQHTLDGIRAQILTGSCTSRGINEKDLDDIESRQTEAVELIEGMTGRLSVADEARSTNKAVAWEDNVSDDAYDLSKSIAASRRHLEKAWR